MKKRKDLMGNARVLLLVGLVAALFVPGVAAVTTVGIGDVSALSGMNATLSIMITDITDVGIAAIQFSYNSSVVHVTEIKDSQFDVCSPIIDNTDGDFEIAGVQFWSNGLNGNVRLANVTLKAVGSPGEWTFLNLTINELKTVGPPPQNIPAEVDGGTFTIQANNPPEPNITKPGDGAKLSGMVTIEELDVSGENDIVYNRFEYYYDKDCNGEADDAGSAWLEIGNDTNGADGWSADWNTSQYPDCCYLIKATMGDEGGLTGEDMISVALSNHNPEPVITNPQTGAKLTGPVTITEVDNGFDQGADIIYNQFEYYYDKDCNGEADDAGSAWLEIGNDTNGADGWSADWDTSQYPDCCYFIRATMGDKHGRTGETQIKVKLDNSPPLVTTPSADPYIIPEDTDNEPLWGELANLRVIVTDESAISSVTINLSELGGGASVAMSRIGSSDVWNVSTNASVGTAGWNGSAYMPYSLQVNATDEHGKVNMSGFVTIQVMENGDVYPDGSVSYSDAMYLYKWKAGKPGFETIYETIAEVDGDGLVSYSDAMYLYKWKARHAGFDLLH